MELQIQDLVSSIKKDGIESANREAAQILAEAKAQAEKIVADIAPDEIAPAGPSIATEISFLYLLLYGI